MILDDEITLLKPLGQNFITFYFPKLNKIVIFDPALQIIVKSFEVHNIQDYEFSNDNKYLFTHGQDIIRIYQIQDDQCFLLREIKRASLTPISFLQNVILCLKSYETYPDLDQDPDQNPDQDPNSDSDPNSVLDKLFADFDFDLKLGRHQDDDDYSQENEDQIRYYERMNYRETHIIDLQGKSLQCEIYNQLDNFETLNNFYLVIYEEYVYKYYQVINKNKRLNKYFFCWEHINDAHQLKYSNFYLTRTTEQLMVMIKQSKNCKIIRKIQLKEQISKNPLYNYHQVIEFLDSQQKPHVKINIINLWDLNKQSYMIDSFKDIVLTQNTNFLVSSEGKCLKIMKMN